MQSGIVKFYNDEKGYGFLINDEGGEVFFCSKEVIDGWPERNSRVQFEWGSNSKGPCARNVRVL